MHRMIQAGFRHLFIGGETHILTTANDISQRILAEQKIKEKNNELEALNKKYLEKNANLVTSIKEANINEEKFPSPTRVDKEFTVGH